MNKAKCVSKKLLIKFMLNEVSEKERFKIIKHIAVCPSCRQEFEVLKEIWAERVALTASIADLELKKGDLKSLHNLANEQIRLLRSAVKKRQRPSLFVRRLIPVFTAGLVVFTVFVAVLFLRNPKEPIERVFGESGISLIQPLGNVKEEALFFQWKKTGQALYYTLEILDKGLETVFVAEFIQEEKFTLPPDVLSNLRSDSTYFWKITAITENNEKRESDLGKFIIESP